MPTIIQNSNMSFIADVRSLSESLDINMMFPAELIDHLCAASRLELPDGYVAPTLQPDGVVARTDALARASVIPFRDILTEGQKLLPPPAKPVIFERLSFPVEGECIEYPEWRDNSVIHMVDINPRKKAMPDDRQVVEVREDLPLGQESSMCEDELINLARLHMRVWEPLPAALHWIYGIVPVETYVHLSNRKPGMIAYNRNGSSDVQVMTTLGRFLRQFSEVHLTDKQIQQISEDFRTLTSGQATHDMSELVKIGYSQEDFYEAYNSGIDSCMNAEKLEQYDLAYHPAEVYASGDFAIYSLSETPGGSARARALVCTKNGMFWNVYPKDGCDRPSSEASERLNAYLLTQGFDRDTDWAEGASLLALRHGDSYLMPYIDKCDYVFKVTDRSGDIVRFVIDDENPTLKEGEYDCSSFCGGGTGYDYDWRLNSDGGGAATERCDCCMDNVDEDCITTVYGGDQRACDNCLSNYFVWSDYEEAYISNDDAVFLDYREEYCLDENAVYVDHPEDSNYETYILKDDSTTTRDRLDITEDEAVEDVQGHIYHRSDVVETPSGFAHVDDTVRVDHAEDCNYDEYIHEGSSVETEDGFTITEDESGTDIHGHVYHLSQLVQTAEGRFVNLDVELGNNCLVTLGVATTSDREFLKGWKVAMYPNRGNKETGDRIPEELLHKGLFTVLGIVSQEYEGQLVPKWPYPLGRNVIPHYVVVKSFLPPDDRYLAVYWKGDGTKDATYTPMPKI
jgi:hypothetical protein